MLMFFGFDDIVFLVVIICGVRDGFFLFDESCIIFINLIL